MLKTKIKQRRGNSREWKRINTEDGNSRGTQRSRRMGQGEKSQICYCKDLSFEVLRARLCSREKKLSFGQVKVEKTVMHTSRFQVEIWVNKSGVVEMFGLER